MQKCSLCNIQIYLKYLQIEDLWIVEILFQHFICIIIAFALFRFLRIFLVVESEFFKDFLNLYNLVCYIEKRGINVLTMSCYFDFNYLSIHPIYYLQVSWIRKRDGAILSVDDMLVQNDERMEIEKTSYLSQWTLKIR